MNILIVANHYAVCSARYAADAFTRLGQTVRHVGAPQGRNIWGMQVPKEYVWTPDDISCDPKNYPDTDVCIVMDSDPDILDGLVETSIDFDPPLICWGVDNHVRDYRREYFDHYFLAHRSVSAMAWEYTSIAPQIYHGTAMPAPLHLMGQYPADQTHKHLYDDMTWLPCATDPAAFPPSPIAWVDRQYDVCMVGVMYPKRWELVNAMRAAGLKVFAGMGLIYDAYREAYQNSRVALVSSFNGDLPIRLFEGAGMGCAVLADEIADLSHIANGPVVTYSSTVGAVKEAERLCAMPADEAKVAIQYSIAWAANHTWDKRAQVIIDWMATR